MYAFPLIAIAIAFLQIGRGAMGGQFLEAERRRDQVARYVCFAFGIAILAVSVALWFF